MLFLSRVGKHKKIITVRCGLVDVNDEGNIAYTVMNPNTKTITLRKNTVIGVFQPVIGKWKLLEWSKDSILGKERAEEEAKEDQFKNCQRTSCKCCSVINLLLQTEQQQESEKQEQSRVKTKFKISETLSEEQANELVELLKKYSSLWDKDKNEPLKMQCLYNMRLNYWTGTQPHTSQN